MIPPFIQLVAASIASGVVKTPVSLHVAGMESCLAVAFVRHLQSVFGIGSIGLAYRGAKLENPLPPALIYIVHGRQSLRQIEYRLIHEANCPAIAFDDGLDLGELVGAWLALQLNDFDAAEVARWLSVTRTLPRAEAGGPVEMRAEVREALRRFEEGCVHDRERNVRVVTGLLAGQAALANDDGDRVEVDVATYRAVRDLLQSDIIAASPDNLDEIAHAIIRRAGALAWALERLRAKPNKRFERLGRIGLERGIALPTIADLGLTRGALVRELAAYLIENNALTRLDVPREAVAPAPERQTVEAVIAGLTQWSYKQAYQRLKHLRELGIVDGKRAAGNGPWIFTIPESLAVRNPFAHLPPIPVATTTTTPLALPRPSPVLPPAE